MRFEEYEDFTNTTANKKITKSEALCNYALGLAGEAGEIVQLIEVLDPRYMKLCLDLMKNADDLAEIVKKHVFHDKKPTREQVVSEAGDVLYYLTQLCYNLGISITEVAEYNMTKLKKRYPAGFSQEAAKAKADEKK